MTVARVSRGLSLSCEIAAAAILAVVCLLNFTQVTGRYAVGSSLNWAEEIMRYSMLWVMMLGGTAAIHRGDHMAVDSLADHFDGRARHLVRSVLFGIAGIFAALLVYYGWPAAIANTAQSAAASRLPMVVPYMALPVGGALMLVQIVLCWVAGFDDTQYEEEPY